MNYLTIDYEQQEKDRKRLAECRAAWRDCFYKADPVAAELGPKLLAAMFPGGHPGMLTLKADCLWAMAQRLELGDDSQKYLRRQLAFEESTGFKFPTEENADEAYAFAEALKSKATNPPARPRATKAPRSSPPAASSVPTVSATPLMPRTVDLLTQAALLEAQKLEAAQHVTAPADDKSLIDEAASEMRDWQNQQLAARGFTTSVPSIGDVTTPRKREIPSQSNRSADEGGLVDEASTEAAEWQNRQLAARGLSVHTNRESGTAVQDEATAQMQQWQRQELIARGYTTNLPGK